MILTTEEVTTATLKVVSAFVGAEINFKVAFITSSVAKITFVEAEMIFKVTVMGSLVVKFTFALTEITFLGAYIR